MKSKETLWPKSSLMFWTLYLIMVGLSKDNPQPRTLRSFGRPMDSSISGLNIPEFPISTHFCNPSCQEKISMEGSV